MALNSQVFFDKYPGKVDDGGQVDDYAGVDDRARAKRAAKRPFALVKKKRVYSSNTISNGDLVISFPPATPYIHTYNIHSHVKVN